MGVSSLISAPQDCDWAIPGLSNSRSYIRDTSLEYLYNIFQSAPTRGWANSVIQMYVCMYVFMYLCTSNPPNSETIRKT